ncbi:MAG TPA: tandem-95 repeat protein, partial [Cyclobacteriaceae bacterium]|nr:tandem-95 repeat protein [Cyclobacteriaceae bacterium]
DPDNTYPTGFTLTVLAGTNYTFTGNTVTPAANFNGVLTVNVRVNDGTDNSNTFGLQLTVTPVNDPPVITGQVGPLSTPEDTPFTVLLSHLTVTDPDNTYPTGFTLTVLAGTNYTFTGNTVTPAANFNGVLTVNVRVNDGTDNSNTFGLQLTVTPVNDPPVITGQVGPLSTPEDTPFTVLLSHLTVTDPDNTYPTGFTLTVLAGTNYTFTGNTVTPAANFNGVLTVNVRVNDGTDNSNTFGLQLTVTPINDPPVITGQVGPLSTPEDTPFTVLLSHLTVTDPDNTYPTGFTLTVLAGTNYTFTGNTVTPAANFNGVLTVNVRVNDGTDNSNTFGLQLTVTPINDPPVITGQVGPLSTPEDTPFTVLLSHLTVTDPDNTYPTGFTLTVLAGTNYTFTGNTVTPAANFNGVLTVNVRVNDGTDNSNTFGLQLTVTPINDPPVITGQVGPLSTPEDTPFTVLLSHLTVTDPDNTYPNDFTLTVLAGTNYTFSGNTVTPALNFNGVLSVNVRVNDGATNSNTFALQLTVTPVNDPPVITGQNPNPINAVEDTPFTIALSNLVITDPDNTVFTLTVVAGTNYTFSGNTVTPALNYFGPLTVNVRVNDGTADSPVFGVAVQVAPVNDPPVITGQTPNPVNATEDTPFTLTTANLIIEDPDNTVFTLTVLAGTNYTFSGNTITPALNYSGPLTVNVRVNDGTVNSNTFGVAVQVAAVNDPPVITGQTPNPINATEDTPFTLTVSNLLITDPDNTIFTLTILPGTNYTFSGNTITPALNYSGPLTVNTQVSDGTSNSNVFGVNVQVAAVNDAPVITGQTPNPLPATEDTPFTIAVSNLIIVDPDNSTFTLTVLSGTNYTFSGNTVTPALNYFGSLSVNVRVSDGQANSNIFGVAVQVAAVNDAPLITGQTPNPINAVEDTPFTLSPSNLLITDPDNTTFTLLVLAGTNYTFSGSTITPALNYFGPLTVNVRVSDGQAESNTFGVAVQVAAVNDPPIITGQVPLTTGDGQPITLKFSDLIVFDPDNTYPTGFELFILSGANYSVSGLTITPNVGYSGNLPVRVFVNDGQANSPIFNLTIQVNYTNKAPTITGQNPLSTNEDTPLTLKVTDFTIDDPDNAYPDDFSLTVLAGTNYTFAGTTITPALNFNGVLTVPVRVNDGSLNSPIFNAQVTVVPVNDPPVIAGQTPNPMLATEDTPFTIQVSNLIITDPDNTTFTLTVLSGTNYTFSGNTITPALNYFGPLTVNVRVSDGTDNSNVFGVAVQVAAVNDPPVITGQVPNPMVGTQNVPFTINLSNLIVVDPDNTTFTLTILPGTNYTFSGNTIIPALNFNGILTVNVRVSDGQANSNTFGVIVNLGAVNVPPTITGQTPNPLPATEDTPFTISISNLIISDPDNTTFTLTILPGTNYTFSGTTITPALNFFGALTVNVRVNDGLADSPAFGVVVQVAPVNDPPVITAQTPNPLVTNEDTPITIQFTNLVVTDPDNPYPTGFTMNVQGGANYSVSGNTVTPALNFFGNLTVPVRVNDSQAFSNIFNVSIQVNPVNDAPVAIPFQAVTVTEDDTNETVVNLLVGFSDVEDAPAQLAYSVVTFTNPTFYQVNPTINQSNLRFSFKPNVFGTTVITVRATDTGGLSVQNTITVNILGINDAPGFNTIPNQVVSENVGPQTITISNISKGPFEEAQTLNFVVSSGNVNIIPTPTINPSTIGPNGQTTAQLTFTVVPSATGVVTITVTAIDNGPNTPVPNQNTYSQNFTITVTEINDPPTLNPISFGPIPEDAPLQLVPLTGITAGPGETQDLTVTVTTNRPELFETLDVQYTSPQATGTLRIKPAKDKHGTATITVRVQDSGLNTPPNVNFITRSFNLVIQSVNDLPEFTSTPVLLAEVGTLYEYIAETIDVDGDAITLTTPVRPSWLTLTTLSNGRARLHGTPTVAAAGNNPVKLRASDGVGSPVDQDFTIFVNSRPVVSPFAIAINEDVTHTFTTAQFANAFSDADGNAMAEVKITTLPKHGVLRFNSVNVAVNQVIAASSLNALTYTPQQDYFGLDTLYWNGGDGTFFSLNQTYAAITINPVNDPPLITQLEGDTLKYEVGRGTLVPLTTVFNAIDVDDETLAGAEIGFRRQNFRAANDRLVFTSTPEITGSYDAQAGILILTGTAPVAAYVEAIRSIQFSYINFDELILDTRSIYITLTDGKNLSETRDRLVRLTYTFEELDIPTAFTPNNDGANDVWKITSSIGLEQYSDAVIRIYNKRGQLVHEMIGFENPWDGTSKGEKLASDVYYYTIDLLYNNIRYRGTVTILK